MENLCCSDLMKQCFIHKQQTQEKHDKNIPKCRQCFNVINLIIFQKMCTVPSFARFNLNSSLLKIFSQSVFGAFSVI